SSIGAPRKIVDTHRSVRSDFRIDAGARGVVRDSFVTGAVLPGYNALSRHWRLRHPHVENVGLPRHDNMAPSRWVYAVTRISGIVAAILDIDESGHVPRNRTTLQSFEAQNARARDSGGSQITYDRGMSFARSFAPCHGRARAVPELCVLVIVDLQ